MTALSRFADVSEEELNALVQKTILEKTKIAQVNMLQKKVKKDEFNSFTRRIDAGEPLALVV